MSDKVCECGDWKASNHQIEQMMVFTQIMGDCPPYTGAFYVYCPWCGEKLKEVEDE